MAHKPAETIVERSGQMKDARSFEALLSAVGRERDRESFVRLFEYFAPRVKSYLIKGGLSQTEADELAQETMLTVWNKAESYNPQQAAASTWIFTIARNKRVDFFRQSRHLEPLENASSLEAADTPVPSEAVQRSEEIEAMERAIRSLPAEQARLLQQSFFEDKSHAEIARDENLPLGTVKSRIRLALDKLRNDEKVKDLWL